MPFIHCLKRASARRIASRLDPLERKVLVLSARDGLSNEEIASRLAISPAEAERLLASALCRLSSALERKRKRRWRLW